MSKMSSSAELDSPGTEGNDLELQITKDLERPQNLFHEILFVAVLCSSQLMAQAGLGQGIVPLYTIGNSFGIHNPGELSWFPAAFSLTVGTFILIAGRFGDLYGHKKFVIGGFAWFGLWSLLAGFSVYSNAIFFDCCRAFQGIGAAFLLPNSIAILGRAYKPGLRKAIIFSLFGATAPAGFVVAGAFSSLLAKFAWWPWAYWILAIVLLLYAVLAVVVIPYTPPPVLDNSESTFTRVDGLGSITGVSGLVLINFAWNQAPVVGWQNPYTYILLIVGFIFMGLFAFVEMRIAKFPLVPLDAMSADIGFLLTCIVFGWASYSVWIYYFWQFLQELRHVSPLLASAQFTPVVVSGLCAAMATGFLLGRVSGSVIMFISLCFFTVGLILLATAPVDQTYWAQTFVSLIIMPWGMDMSFPAATLLLSNAMPKEHQGVAASLVNTLVNYSISIALGIAGTIEGHVNDGGRDLLRGYRGAWYLGIGLSGSGAIIAVIFGLDTWRKSKRIVENSSEEKES